MIDKQQLFPKGETAQIKLRKFNFSDLNTSFTFKTAKK